MSTRVAITGAAGQLGRRTAELVLAQCARHAMSSSRRAPRTLSPTSARGAEVRYADFDEPQSLPAAFAGAERLSCSSAQRTCDGASHNTELRSPRLRCCGVRHVIYTSGVKPAPPNPANAASHHATEQALAASGLAWTILRNSLYADYQVAEATRAAERRDARPHRGDGRVAYVARDDCAAAVAAVRKAVMIEPSTTSPEARPTRRTARSALWRARRAARRGTSRR